MKTLADIVALAKSTLEAQQTALNSALPNLPEAVRAELAAYRDKLNTQLAALPPIEQVKGALEADGLINWMGSLCSEMATLHSRLMEKMSGMGNLQTALNSYEDRVKSGELVEKAKVAAAVDMARSEGRKEVLTEVLAARKGLVETAGLPLPAEDVLTLGATQFSERFAQAQKNAADIKARTGQPNAQKALTSKYAWLPAAEFAGEMDSLSALLTPPAAPADPLLGAGAGAGAGAGQSPEPKKKVREII